MFNPALNRTTCPSHESCFLASWSPACPTARGFPPQVQGFALTSAELYGVPASLFLSSRVTIRHTVSSLQSCSIYRLHETATTSALSCAVPSPSCYSLLTALLTKLASLLTKELLSHAVTLHTFPLSPGCMAGDHNEEQQG